MKRVFSLVICAGTAALFAVAINWVWQMACLARESTETVRTARLQLESMGAALAETSADLRKLQAKLTGWVDGDGAQEWSRAMTTRLLGDEKPRTATADAEIERLLAKLRDSQLKWASAEGEKPVLLLYGIVVAKYGMMKRSVATPEEFIAKVADVDLFGKPMKVTEPGGETLSLQAWLERETARPKGQ